MNERLARAQRASAAWDEFIAPVVIGMQEEYRDRLIEVSTKTLSRNERCDKITSLSTAIRLLDNISNHIAAVIKDGEVARAELQKMERRNDLTAPARRLLDIAPR